MPRWACCRAGRAGMASMHWCGGTARCSIQFIVDDTARVQPVAVTSLFRPMVARGTGFEHHARDIESEGSLWSTSAHTHGGAHHVIIRKKEPCFTWHESRTWRRVLCLNSPRPWLPRTPACMIHRHFVQRHAKYAERDLSVTQCVCVFSPSLMDVDIHISRTHVSLSLSYWKSISTAAATTIITALSLLSIFFFVIFLP